MHCIICQKSDREAELFEGIYEGEISKICERCADSESIPLIRKPNPDQLIATERVRSVRERLENLSGTRQLNKEQVIANKNLAKIKFPEKKQHSELLVDNYYWILKMARRRKKLTLKDISESTHISVEILDSLERGKLPKDTEDVMRKLEMFFSIKLLRTHELSPKFILPDRDRQERILAETKERIDRIRMGEIPEEIPIKRENEKQRMQAMRKIQRGEMDFSKPENIQNITLSDLQEMKKKRDLKAQFEREKVEHEEFFGGDLEIEEADEIEIEEIDDKGF